MKVSILDLHFNKSIETEKISKHLVKYCSTQTTRLFSEEIKYYDPSSFDGVVLSGSDYPKLLQDQNCIILKEKIIDASKCGVQVLGICAGNELLGTFFGYRIYKMRPEIGWPEVHITKKGQQDPIFSDLPPIIRPFQFHSKGVRIDDKNMILAENSRFVQGIIFSPTIRGIQFHPEESPEEGIDFLKKNQVYQNNPGVLSASKNYVEWKIFGNFIKMLKF